MKKNIGAVLALYPTPAAVVGSLEDGKPNWLMIGHLGIIGHDRILISMHKAHFSNKRIIASKKLSVNMVNEAMLPRADYAGTVSGAVEDKSALFEWHEGEAGTPVIDESPLTMECEVVDNYETETFDNFICKIADTCAGEDVLDENGKIDYTKLKPVLFEMPTYSYLRTGEIIGKCRNMAKKEK